jgi:hypothetical protein
VHVYDRLKQIHVYFCKTKWLYVNCNHRSVQFEWNQLFCSKNYQYRNYQLTTQHKCSVCNSIVHSFIKIICMFCCHDMLVNLLSTITVSDWASVCDRTNILLLFEHKSAMVHMDTSNGCLSATKDRNIVNFSQQDKFKNVKSHRMRPDRVFSVLLYKQFSLVLFPFVCCK